MFLSKVITQSLLSWTNDNSIISFSFRRSVVAGTDSSRVEESNFPVASCKRANKLTSMFADSDTGFGSILFE